MPARATIALGRSAADNTTRPLGEPIYPTYRQAVPRYNRLVRGRQEGGLNRAK